MKRDQQQRSKGQRPQPGRRRRRRGKKAFTDVLRACDSTTVIVKKTTGIIRPCLPPVDHRLIQENVECSAGSHKSVLLQAWRVRCGHSRQLRAARKRKLQSSSSSALLSFRPFVLQRRSRCGGGGGAPPTASAPLSPPLAALISLISGHLKASLCRFETQRRTKRRSVTQATDSRPHKNLEDWGSTNVTMATPLRGACISVGGG